ncbi:RHS repeat-associated core domain-containing protein [Salibacter halophilus]|uniref:RHS repeat-associated core domain-containing protein n=1 Tax=Salibacter halophilus TaxID=1803916 RepID=A0A6N6M8B6_9FLAO|nr:hypothetical protein [Salibacter halophilus]KAB1064900.1 hypothetical protein F3059_05980 [Salibacter halophilus]
MEKQPDSVNIATVYNYNGLEDYELNHLTRYAKGSEFMISLSGSTLSSTPGIKFHYTDIDSVEHITQACTTTGTIPSVAADLFNLINIEPELDVEWVSGSSTSFIVSGNKGNAILPIAAKVSYNKFEDLTITITALEETEQISQHFHHYGNSQYELPNHLGNVQSVVSNRYLFANETIHEEDFSTDFWGGMTIWGSSGLSVNTNNGDLTASGSNGYVTLSLNTTPSIGHELRFDLADASSSITVRIRNTTTNNIISSETFTNGTDHKYQFTPNGDIQIEWYTSPNQTFSIDNVEVIERGDEILADVRTYQDFYPFGMLSRKYNSPDYSRGFNGQIKTDEIAGEGNHNTARYWEYDTRLGRRWNIDPKPNPSIGGYATFANNPILFSDPLGDTLRFGWFARTFRKGKIEEYMKKLNADVRKHTNLNLIEKNGYITYSRREGNTPTSSSKPVASALAKGLMMKAINSRDNIKVKFSSNGNRFMKSSNYADKSGHRNGTLFIDMDQTLELQRNFISNSVTSETIGFAFTMYHELDHIYSDSWDPGSTSLSYDPNIHLGGTFDPMGIARNSLDLAFANASRPGLTVSNINSIRQELTNSLGQNYGQRRIYSHIGLERRTYIFFNNAKTFGGGHGGTTFID